MHIRIFLAASLLCISAGAQEQIDQGDAAGKGRVNINALSLRVRVKTSPEQKGVQIAWRRGGEGLGGTVIKGEFLSADKAPLIALGQWSAPLPLPEIAGKGGGWQFPTIVVLANGGKPGGKRTPNTALSDVAVEFELSEAGKVVKTFTETAPKGATVSIAIPLAAADRATFIAGLVGISEHARNRHLTLDKSLGQPAAPPKLFGIIGHLAGYGEGSGYGIRHNNPDIVKEECATLALLGVNGLVSERSINLVDAAGAGRDFRQVYWGGPGSGSPMGIVNKRAEKEEGCPYDPRIAPAMAASVKKAIEDYKTVGAKQSWALWWDEIGVAAKGHLQTCPKCREKFVEYLKAQKIEPADVGAKSWEEVKPFPIFGGAEEKGNKIAAAPADAKDALRYYYTYRFMTEATAQLFTEPAKQFKEAGVYLYAMQGPTPSWAGHSLDWHEFYDRGANTALVFETSNRDPRSWQFESYLADIGRGICARHDMPMGVLVKPHRGAVAQRMLAVAARGAKVIEWYTYGPDYAKGDSFSQSADLLERTGRAARFLAANEQYLYDAKPAIPAEVAFCSPRSSEIWGKATDLGVTAFEDAKWVYIALRHHHVPIDVISEQQLAEGKLDQYKAIYIVGPNLRRDAEGQLAKWVEAGGILWTDAMGLSRDEANQPAYSDLTGLKERKLQTWGQVEPYKATEIKALVEKDVPPGANVFVNAQKHWAPSVGREPLDTTSEHTIMNGFVDGKSADAMRTVGKGKVYVAGVWVGLTYSARVRRGDFDMSTDFLADGADEMLTLPLDDHPRPVWVSVPTVEALALNKDGKRSIALMNWAYKSAGPGARGAVLVPATNLRVAIKGIGEVKRVRSAATGELKLTSKDGGFEVVVPRVDEIDLLIVE